MISDVKYDLFPLKFTLRNDWAHHMNEVIANQRDEVFVLQVFWVACSLALHPLRLTAPREYIRSSEIRKLSLICVQECYFVLFCSRHVQAFERRLFVQSMERQFRISSKDFHFDDPIWRLLCIRNRWLDYLFKRNCTITLHSPWARNQIDLPFNWLIDTISSCKWAKSNTCSTLSKLLSLILYLQIPVRGRVGVCSVHIIIMSNEFLSAMYFIEFVKHFNVSKFIESTVNSLLSFDDDRKQ